MRAGSGCANLEREVQSCNPGVIIVKCLAVRQRVAFRSHVGDLDGNQRGQLTQTCKRTWSFSIILDLRSFFIA